MSILFIHGVNVRDDSREYTKGVGLRRKLFDRLVVPVAREAGFDGFRVEPDVYWGGLGADFAWSLGSVPRSTIESLGDEEGAPRENRDLLSLLAEVSTTGPAGSPDLDVLGAGEGNEILARAAREEPARFVRAVVAPEVEDLVPGPAIRRPEGSLQPGEREEFEAEGQRLALLLLAADEVSRDPDAAAALRGTGSDDEALDVVTNRVAVRFAEFAASAVDAPVDAGVEALGTDPIEWVGRRLRRARRAAKRLVERITESVARGPSLLLLSALREKLTRPALLFFGDVFIYFHRGRGADGDTIATRVERAVRAAARDRRRTGPLVVVSHSFGSMILYDLLTSGRLDGVDVDLWVTAGAQVSLFAEMRLFSSSPHDVPSTGRPHLGRPRGVRRWVNVYDAADTLSYLMEPVFGRDGVVDIEFREGAHLLNAHGDYFTEPAFYRLVTRELQQVL